MQLPDDKQTANRQEYLRQLYEAARQQDMPRLEKLLSAPIPSAEIEAVAWGNLAQDDQRRRWAEEQARRQQDEATNRQRELEASQKRKGRRGRVILVILGSVLLFFILIGLMVGAFLLGRYTATKATSGSNAAPKAMASEASATPTHTPRPQIPIPKPPTTSPIQQLPPSLTITPIPSSRYYLAPGIALYPFVPVQAQAAWLLGDRDATASPPFDNAEVWNKAVSSDPNAGKQPYFVTTVGNATVTWQMDVPMEAGLYMLYILDTVAESSGPVDFQVFWDGAQVNPVRGSSKVIFNIKAPGGQIADAWLPIGAYWASQGQALEVQATVGERNMDTPMAIDRLLVTRLSKEAEQMLVALPKERLLYSLVDDEQATFYSLQGDQAIKLADLLQPQSERYGELAWNNRFKSWGIPWNTNLVVLWEPQGRLPAGEYELYVWVPAAHATATGKFQLLADGVVVPRDNPAPIKQADFPGQWVSLGSWRLAQEAAVSVRLVVSKDANLLPDSTQAEIGADSVALVYVGP